MPPYKSRYQHLLESPLWWNNKANDLYASAGIIWFSMENEEIIDNKIKEKIGLSNGFSFKVACPSVCYMLVGLSFELVLKSIIVANDNSKSPPPIHKLVNLAKDAAFPISEKEKGIFNVLSAYINWAGKYPITIKSSDYDNDMELMEKVLYVHCSDTNFPVFHYNGVLEWNNLQTIWKRANNHFFEVFH